MRNSVPVLLCPVFPHRALGTLSSTVVISVALFLTRVVYGVGRPFHKGWFNVIQCEAGTGPSAVPSHLISKDCTALDVLTSNFSYKDFSGVIQVEEMVYSGATIRGITVQEWVYHRPKDYVDTAARLVYEVRVWRSVTHAGN